MRTQPVIMVALTGFLGSGKTSVLEHWLKQSPFAPVKSALIINDFGPVNIDALLLAQSGIVTSSIAGGCVCCTSYGELEENLLRLAGNPQLEIIWIETSGLAEPEEMIDHLTSSALMEKVKLKKLVHVVDAAHFPSSWRHRAAEAEQLQYADWIILNKTDLIDEIKKIKLLEKIRRYNSRAEIDSAVHGKIDSQKLWDDETDMNRPSTVSREQIAHVHEADGNASTFFYPLSQPVKRSEFEKFLQQLPENVYRAKGFVRFQETPQQLFTFQQVEGQQELLLFPVEIPSVIPGIVFIGPQLDLPLLNKHLNDQFLINRGEKLRII